MSRRRLPFEPESLESMKARYPSAIADLIDVESVKLGLQYDPGADRKHVFDTEDGIRFIISREDQGEDGRVIHFSTSVNDENFPADLKKKAFKEGVDFILAMMEHRFREISGYRDEFGVGVTDLNGIPHWYIFESGKHKDPRLIRFE